MPSPRALVVIAIVVTGLLYMRFAHGPDGVKVPSGAHAGQLALHACEYKTEQGTLPADCGTLVVPENRRDARSRLIALPVTRVRARSAQPGEPIFRMEGGPGLTNLDFAAASRFNARHDVVLVGYRGVDGSSKLDCPEVADARRTSGDLLGTASIDASVRAYKDCAARLQRDGVDLAGYTLAQRVDDLEAARQALGYKRVDLLSESAGTRTALIYGWRYPASIQRSVLIGVNPPGHFLWNPQQTEAQLRRFAALGGGASIDRPLPKRWGPFAIKPGNVRVASFFGLMDSGDDAPVSAPVTLEQWRSGDGGGYWFMSVLADLLFPRIQVWGDSAAVARSDAGVAAAHYPAGHPGNDFLWARGQLAHAWPSSPDDDAYSRVRDSAVQTLMIGGTVDGSTPAENATKELLPHLRNGHQVVLEDFGHTTDFWHTQEAAGSHLINTYLDRGTVDASRYHRQAIDFTPPRTLGSLARIVIGVLIALALAALLSLAWLAYRGRRPRVLARTVLVPVLGLGGWALGTLFALSVFPSLPLDSATLVVPAVGLPIALAAFLSWAGPRTAGLAGACAGALLGGWLGFGCASGPLALLTAIAGAAVGANLMLIATDVSRRPPSPRPAGGRAA